MADRLRFALIRSVTLFAWLVAGHLVGLTGLWSAPMPWLLKAVGGAGILVSLVLSVRRHALRSASDAIVELELREDCSASVLRRDGAREEFSVDGSSYVSPVLTIVTLRPRTRGRMRAVLIAPDCVQQESFRRARVWLRWRCAGSGEQAVDGGR
jgi:toxin CptA